MIKNYYFSFLLICCAVTFGYGQIATQSFEASGDTWTPLTFSTPPCTTVDTWDYTTSLSAITPSDGAQFWGIHDLNGTCGGAGFETITFPSQNISTYTGVTISFDYYTIGFDTGDDLGYEIWEDGVQVVDLINLNDNTGGWTTISYNVTAAVNNVYLVLKARQNGNDDYGAFDNVILDGTSTCTDAVDFANIQSPTTTQAITVGGIFDVYARTYEPGVTPTAGASANINAWIGYSTTNTNPNTWTDWVPATFNAQFGNDDEYQAEIGTSITVPGTYYFASRFELNGCSGSYAYGGSGGDWSNDSVQLNVLADQVDFCSLQSPATGTQALGGQYNVYARVFELGVTPTPGSQANISAWIGFNTTDAVILSDFTDPSWTWVPATWNLQAGNDDEYIADIGPSIPTGGTYYYVSRFQLNGSDYSYGGITPPNGGNHWDGTTYISGVLTVTGPCASESFVNVADNGSYNTKSWTGDNSVDWTATDSRSDQDLAGDEAIMLRNGSLTNDNSIAGGCGVISFDYARIYSGNSTLQVFINGIQYGGNITVSATTSTTFTTTVNVPGPIDLELRNSGNRTLISNLNWTCYAGGANPEIQLVDNTATNQNCGYTIDFGNVANDSSTSDLTFDIENVGSVDLNITSFGITGDYTVVSPVAPFVITGGNSQTVTVRFAPLSDGTLTGALTINNDDLDESACVVNLTGVGFTPGPNINVRGVIGSNPTIANGSTTTSSLNNTLFAQQTISTTQQTKTFRIGNEGGTAPLTVSSITLTGDTADFFVTSSFTNPFAIDTFQDFTITFQPTTLSGLRSATVSIANSDSTKDPYTFVVEGTANCPAVSGSISPSEGPVGTIVTILSPGNDLSSATAELNGVPLSIISASVLELIVRLPNTIVSGGPLSVQLPSGCIFSNAFSLIDETIAGCQTSTSATVGDLFISEVTDSPSGSLTYIELYNATGAAINFATTNYRIRIYNNGNTSSPKELILNSGTVTNNSTYVISAGVTGTQCSVAGGDGSLAQADISTPGASINFFRNSSGVDNPNIGHDFIGLYSASSVLIDAWGVFGDQTWATGLGIGLKGANFQRDTAATIPNTTYSNADWIITDWDDADCTDVDYTTIGVYDFSTGVSPTITLQPADPAFACAFSTSLTIAGTEGFNGPTPPDAQELAYQWYYHAPGDLTWTEILPTNANYTGQQAATLNIINTFNLDGYQYYCQLREDSSTCFEASNAVVLSVLKSVWDGTWSSPPTIGRVAVIDANYNTSVGGVQTSFEACQCIVNTGNELFIANNTFVRVDNNLTVDGSMVVQTNGSFVQVNDAAITDGAVLTTRNKVTVEKETASLGSYFEYTYWSAPVSGELISNGLTESHANRIYWFNGQNFLDATQETNNDNTAVAGQDDIDDNGNDWQFAAGGTIMTPGVGYAATHNVFSTFPNQFVYVFEGPFNNGIYNVPIYRNDAELNDNNWNFIGNPYPSAIDADLFLTANASIDQNAGGVNGAIFFWSHATAADVNTNGNENLNYAQSCTS